MAQITGGELGFEFTLDAENLKKELIDSEGRIVGFTEAAEKAGITIQNSFAKSGSKVQDFTGIVKENISIQKQVIKELEGQIKEVYDRAAGMAPGISQATILDSAKGIEKELASEKAALAELELQMNKTADTSKSLSARYTEAKNRLAELNLANKQGTAEYAAAEAEVKKYGTALSDTNARAKALTAGTIGSLAQGLSLVTGTMAMGTSLMGVFGGKSEDLNQIMLKTQALLAATVTLQEIKNTTMQKGGVISGVMAVQEYARARGADAAALASGRATVAQKAWNLVANANPYVLLATAILTVVGAIGLYVVATNRAEAKTKALIDLNKNIADSAAEPLVAYRNLQAQWNALGDDLKAKEKFIKDNKDNFDELGTAVNTVSEAENVLKNNSAAFVKAMMLRAEAAALAQQAIEAMKKSIETDSEYKRKNIKGDTTVWEDLSRLTPAAQRRKAAEEAEQVRADYQATLDIAKKQQEVQEKLESLNKRAGFKTPSKGTGAKSASNKPTTTPATVADEYFPPGSVAEIQKRLSAIDEALSKSNNDDSTKLLKARRIDLALELAAAEKKIRIKIFDEEMAETKKQIELRDRLLQAGYSKEKVDAMLPEVKDKSYIGYLEETASSLKNLVSAGDNTEQTASNIIKIREAIEEFKGNETFLDDVANSIERLKSEFSGSELISELEKYKSTILDGATEDQKNARQLAAKEAIKQEETALKAAYQNFLNEHQTYEEQRAAISKKYADLRAQANTPEAVAKVDNAEAKEQSDLFLKELQNSDAWLRMFSEMEAVAISELTNFRNILIQKLKEAKTEAEKIQIGEFIKKIDDEIRNRNPFQSLKDSFQNLTDKIKEGTATAADFIAVLKDIDSVKSQVNGLIDSFQGVSDALGLNIDTSGAKETFNNVIDGVSGIGQAVSGFLSKNPMEMVKGVVKAVSSIGKLFNKDAKKERAIQQQAAVVKELEAAYNSLSKAIDQAMGDKYFDASKQAIDNLNQQKAAIEGMIRTEQSKKKADKNKISDYQNAINGINDTIEDLYKSMADKVLNGLDAKSLSDKLTDALTSAFQNGEDAALAMGATVDDILKDMVKNALQMKILEPAMQGVVDKMLASMGYGAKPLENQIQNRLVNLQKQLNSAKDDKTKANLEKQIADLKLELQKVKALGSFDGLTDAERAELKAMIAAASGNYVDALKEYADLFGSSAEQAQGMKGDIKGITEKTAGALEAQMNAIRTYQVEGLNIHRNNQQTFIASLQNLVMIEYNTRPLHRIDRNIEEMNSKMSKGLAGLP